MNAPPRRFSLRAKWLALVLVVALVPLVLVAVVVTAILRHGLLSVEKELEVAVVDETATSVQATMDSAREGTLRVAALLVDRRVAEEARLALASDTFASVESLTRVSVFDREGRFVDALERSAGGRPGVDRADLQVAELPVSPRGGWTTLRRGGSVRAAFTTRLDAHGETTGYVRGDLDVDVLGRRINELSVARFAAPGRVVVVDESLGSLFGESPTFVAEALSALNVLPATFGEPVGLTTEFVSRGESMVGTVRTIPDRRWLVAVARPASEAFASLHRARRAFVLATALVAAVAFLAASLLALRTVRPIGELVALTRAYARRDFAAANPVRSGDELEVLGASMQEMAGALLGSELEIAERARTEAALSRYMPAEVVARIVSGRDTLELGGARRYVTALFADVAQFSSFVATAEPEAVAKLLNEIFSLLSEVVFRHQGMLDKFVGDCLMAVFQGADGPERAVLAARDMHRFVETHRPAWKTKYGFEVGLAIGIATGPAVVGNLGSEARMEYTAIGDAVNVASRLESMAQSGQTLVTAAVAAALGDEIATIALGRHAVRGQPEPLEIHEVTL